MFRALKRRGSGDCPSGGSSEPKPQSNLASKFAVGGRPIKAVPAEWFLNGSLLKELADEFMYEKPAHITELTFGTMCSGTEVTSLCFEACTIDYPLGALQPK
jgi:hypothetical protein